LKKTGPAISSLIAPPGFVCLDGARLFVWRPEGVINEVVLDKILAFLACQEGRFGRPYNRFTDLTSIDAVDVTFKYVFHFALYRRLSRVGREPLKSAILATAPVVVRHVKLHALVTDHSPLEVRLFKDYASAAKWLDVPVDLLEKHS
jgi:hypothetical protein